MGGRKRDKIICKKVELTALFVRRPEFRTEASSGRSSRGFLRVDAAGLTGRGYKWERPFSKDGVGQVLSMHKNAMIPFALQQLIVGVPLLVVVEVLYLVPWVESSFPYTILPLISDAHGYPYFAKEFYFLFAGTYWGCEGQREGLLTSTACGAIILIGNQYQVPYSFLFLEKIWR